MPVPECCKRDRAYLEQCCRATAHVVPLPDDVLLARVLGEPLMFLDAHDRTFSPWAAMTGYWESWITLAIARTIRPGAFCLDVGANHGFYALLMALSTGESGQVCAVEPVPRLAGLARWTMEVNGVQRWCEVREAAASATDGEIVSLAMDQHHGCNSSIARPPLLVERVLDVPTVTIDTLTQDWAPGELVIKIDVEGAEEAVWQGMQQTLERWPRLTLILEVNTARYADPVPFYQALAARFPLRAIDPQGRPYPVTIDELLTEHVDQDWMLYLRRPGML